MGDSGMIGLVMDMGDRSAVLEKLWEVQGLERTKTRRNLPDNFILALPESKSAEIDVFQKLGDGHEVNETVALFTTKRLVAESLCKQEVRYESGRVSLDDGKDEDRKENVSGDGRGRRWWFRFGRGGLCNDRWLIGRG